MNSRTGCPFDTTIRHGLEGEACLSFQGSAIPVGLPSALPLGLMLTEDLT